MLIDEYLKRKNKLDVFNEKAEIIGLREDKINDVRINTEKIILKLLKGLSNRTVEINVDYEKMSSYGGYRSEKLGISRGGIGHILDYDIKRMSYEHFTWGNERIIKLLTDSEIVKKVLFAIKKEDKRKIVKTLHDYLKEYVLTKDSHLKRHQEISFKPVTIKDVDNAIHVIDRILLKYHHEVELYTKKTEYVSELDFTTKEECVYAVAIVEQIYDKILALYNQRIKYLERQLKANKKIYENIVNNLGHHIIAKEI